MLVIFFNKKKQLAKKKIRNRKNKIANLVFENN